MELQGGVVLPPPEPEPETESGSESGSETGSETITNSLVRLAVPNLGLYPEVFDSHQNGQVDTDTDEVREGNFGQKRQNRNGTNREQKQKRPRKLIYNQKRDIFVIKYYFLKPPLS